MQELESQFNAEKELRLLREGELRKVTEEVGGE